MERQLHSDYCRSRLEAARRQVGRNGRSGPADGMAADPAAAAAVRLALAVLTGAEQQIPTHDGPAFCDV